jgi:hypothetical protein
MVAARRARTEASVSGQALDVARGTGRTLVSTAGTLLQHGWPPCMVTRGDGVPMTDRDASSRWKLSGHVAVLSRVLRG